MESTSESGRIQLSRATYERTHDMGMEFEERRIDVKGKGLCQTYLLKQQYHVNPLETAEMFEIEKMQQEMPQDPLSPVHKENECPNSRMMLKNHNTDSAALLNMVGRDSKEHVEKMLMGALTKDGE